MLRGTSSRLQTPRLVWRDYSGADGTVPSMAASINL